jgi:hypothetical protein
MPLAAEQAAPGVGNPNAFFYGSAITMAASARERTSPAPAAATAVTPPRIRRALPPAASAAPAAAADPAVRVPRSAHPAAPDQHPGNDSPGEVRYYAAFDPHPPGSSVDELIASTETVLTALGEARRALAALGEAPIPGVMVTE